MLTRLALATQKTLKTLGGKRRNENRDSYAAPTLASQFREIARLGQSLVIMKAPL